MRRLSSFSHEELHSIEDAAQETAIPDMLLLAVIRSGDWSLLDQGQARALDAFLEKVRVHQRARRIFDATMGYPPARKRVEQ